jgi:hypothetical protein
MMEDSDNLQEVCYADECRQQAGHALLQVKQSSAITKVEQWRINVSGPAQTAPLDENGYSSVKVFCSPQEMTTFVRRVITKLGLEMCHAGGLSGFVLYYFCEESGQSYKSLEDGLRGNLEKHCTFLSRGQCKDLPSDCEGVAGATFPPCGSTPVSTTVPGTTAEPLTTTGAATTAEPLTTTGAATTINPDLCQGSPKDIFVAIDASDSVGNAGWPTQATFLSDLVTKVLGGGNPLKHRMNVHLFHGVTAPLTPLNTGSDAIAEGKNDGPRDYPNKANAFNNIGTFVDKESELKEKINKLKYNDIRFGKTDHPQVFITAKKAFESDKSQNKQILILITDGETHKGEGCDKLNKKEQEVIDVVGDCNAQPAQKHACWRADSSKSCKLEKCMCGLYFADKFKKQKYPVIVVGITNKNQGMLRKTLQEMSSSPDEFFFATDFDTAEMNTALNDLAGTVCKL